MAGIVLEECEHHGLTALLLVCLAFFLCGPAAAFAGPPDIPGMLVYQEADDEPNHAVLVDKEAQELLLYEFGDEARLLKRMPCSTGENNGPKRDAGDGKTPEGVYFVTTRHEARDLAPIYGSLAFPIDYPNYLDRLKGLGGSAIWLHGTNKPLKDRDSNGCVVLTNADIDLLAAFLEVKRTPILIAGKMTYRNAVQTRRLADRALEFLDGWRLALEKGVYHELLAFYAPDYMPAMNWWNEWNRIRGRLRDIGRTMTVQLTRRAVYVHDGVYVALFDQQLTVGGVTVPTGTRQLFFRNEGDGFRIVGDRDQPFAARREKAGGLSALTRSAAFLYARYDDEYAIRRMIDDWLDAWSAGDMPRYGRYYAGNFFSRGMDRIAWLAYKDRLNRRYAFVRVTQADIHVAEGTDHRRASFIQTYECDQFTSTGRKRLELIRQEGEWKILRETWEKL